MKGDQTLFRNSILKSVAFLLLISIFGNYSPEFCSDREWDAGEQYFFFSDYHPENQSDFSEEEFWFQIIEEAVMTPELKQNIMPACDNSMKTVFYAANDQPILAGFPFGDHDILGSDTHQQINSDGGNGAVMIEVFGDWSFSSETSGSELNDYITPKLYDGFLSIIKMPDRHTISVHFA